MANDIEATRARVKGYLDRLVDDYEITSDQNFTFRRGSTRTFVELGPHGKNNTVVHVWAFVAVAVQPTPALYEFLVRSEYTFGHLTLADDDDGAIVTFTHSLLGEHLDWDEFNWATSTVTLVADELDDEVVEKFGGRRYQDDTPEPSVQAPPTARAPDLDRALRATPAADAGSAPTGPSAAYMAADAAWKTAASWAPVYASACTEVVRATNAVAVIANQAIGARDMTNQRPQHEESIRTFTRIAEKKEGEFVPLYRAFVEACTAAREAAASFVAAQTTHDPEMILWPCVSEDAYEATGLASHILRTEFGSTPAAFVDSLRQANAAIQADVFHWGEDGFQGHIYRP